MFNPCVWCHRYNPTVWLGACRHCIPALVEHLASSARTGVPLDSLLQERLAARHGLALALEAVEELRAYDLPLEPPFVPHRGRFKNRGYAVTDEPCQDHHVPILHGLECMVCKGARKVKQAAARLSARRNRDPETYDLVTGSPGAIIPKDAGHKVYRDGTPCKKGHTGYRRVSNDVCVSCLWREPPVEVLNK